MPFSQDERVHFASIVASKFAGFDYSVCNLQEKVYKTCMTDLDDLKHRIRTEWAKLDHADIVAAVVHQWRRRFRVPQGRRRSFRRLFFDVDIVLAAITTTFLAVVDQSNTLIGRFGLIAVVSCALQYITTV